MITVGTKSMKPLVFLTSIILALFSIAGLVNASPAITFTNPIDQQIVPRNSVVDVRWQIEDVMPITQWSLSTSGGSFVGFCNESISGDLHIITCHWSVPKRPRANYQLTATANDSTGGFASAAIRVRSGS